MILGALPRITVTLVDACRASNGKTACRPDCKIFNGRTMHWALGLLQSQAAQWHYFPDRTRTALYDCIGQFLMEQFKRIGPVLKLDIPAFSEAGTTLCGDEKAISTARLIVDQSTNILLFPSSASMRVEKAVPHRMAIAQSTLRYVSEQAVQAEARLVAGASAIAPSFQLQPEQIIAMLTEGRSSGVMAAFDPHGRLRGLWREYRERKIMVDECQAALACLEQFLYNHGLLDQSKTPGIVSGVAPFMEVCCG